MFFGNSLKKKKRKNWSVVCREGTREFVQPHPRTFQWATPPPAPGAPSAAPHVLLLRAAGRPTLLHFTPIYKLKKFKQTYAKLNISGYVTYKLNFTIFISS